MTQAPDVNAIPRPWNYNPSAWSQRVPIAIIAAAAFVIALILGLYQWRLIGGVWDPIFGEQTLRVLDSEPSEKMRRWFRIPDAIFGAIAYLGDVIFALAGSTRRWQYRPWLVVIFGFDVIPLGIVSVILVIVQGFVLSEWCFLCLVTAVISIILIWYAYDEVWSYLLYLWTVWKKSGSRKVAWDTFWGRPSEIAEQVGLEFTQPKKTPSEADREIGIPGKSRKQGGGDADVAARG